MTQHIYVHQVLREAVRRPYSDLVTRPTGEAVRKRIEQALADDRTQPSTAAVIDFSNVGLVDHSCADEIVAKLMVAAMSAPATVRTILFRGLSEAHVAGIEPVLDSRKIAIVVERDDGDFELLGVVSTEARAIFPAIAAGTRDVGQIARHTALSEDVAARALHELTERRLIPPSLVE